MLTITDTVTFLPKIGLLAFDVAAAAAGAPFRSTQDKQDTTTGQHVGNAFKHSFIANMSAGQIQWFLGEFKKPYESWCKSNGMKPRIDKIPNTDISGMWIGSPSEAKYVNVFYHGGGYIIPGNDGHVSLAARMYKWSDGQIAVFCPDYTLAPHGTYPLQIGQCVEALRYVLSLPGVTPDKVMLTGDSVGGNFAVAVLSHVSGHPHPNSAVVKPLEISGPLKSALLTCPWVSGDMKRFSDFDKLSHKDVPTPFIKYFETIYRGNLGADYVDQYVWPETAPSKWWSDLKVKSILACVGESESIKQPSIAWHAKVREGLKQGNQYGTTFKDVIGEKEVHLDIMNPKSDQDLDRLGEKVQEGAFRSWIYDIVGRSQPNKRGTRL